MTAAVSTLSAIPMDPRTSAIDSGIAATIPAAQVRLFGSRPSHDRVRVLGDLWLRFSCHQLPLDLLLYSESEVLERQQFRSAVTTQAYQEGILLHG